MATIEFVPYALSNHVSNQALSKWNRAVHEASNDIADEQLALQLWKQQHKQGVFNTSNHFGFTGMLSRLQSQRRTNR